MSAAAEEASEVAEGQARVGRLLAATGANASVRDYLTAAGVTDETRFSEVDAELLAAGRAAGEAHDLVRLAINRSFSQCQSPMERAIFWAELVDGITTAARLEAEAATAAR